MRPFQIIRLASLQKALRFLIQMAKINEKSGVNIKPKALHNLNKRLLHKNFLKSRIAETKK